MALLSKLPDQSEDHLMTIAHAPKDLLLLIANASSAKPSSARQLSAPTSAMPQVGSRNMALASHAGVLVRKGLTIEAVRASCLAVNQLFDEPLPENEVERVAESVCRYDPAIEINEQHLSGIFARELNAHLKYRPGFGWMHYRDGVWTPDVQGLIAQEYTKNMLMELKARIESHSDMNDGDRGGLLKRLAGLQKLGPIRSIAALASSNPDVLDRGSWDDAPMLVNFRNGTIRLPGLELQPHDPTDRLTLAVPYDFDSEAACPLFMKTLEDALGEEEGRFLLRMVGQALTGQGGGQKMLFCIGSGRNGKSTVIEAISHAMGPYAKSADPASFTKSQFDKGINNDIARLHNARLVTISEWPLARQLDAPLLKRLLGDEKVSARFLYQEAFEFVFRGLPIVSTNFMPTMDGADFGITRRTLVLKFRNVIPEDKVDPQLPRKLRSEAAGIMNVLLRAAVEHLEGAHEVPASVAQDTKAFVASADQVGMFLDDRCRREGEIGAAELYAHYKMWAADEGASPMGNKHLKETLEKKGFIHRRKSAGIQWEGLSMRQ